MNILYNILWIIFAYLIGSLNFSIILTKFSSKKNDIREVGSGNAGATNAMRTHGLKFGLLIFVLDASKSFWLGFVLGLIQEKTVAFNSLIPQLIVLFVIIGHIFPIYFRFKGGKGAACLLGMIASISLILAAIGTILFFIIVGVTKYVSLGSITVPFAIAALAFICPYFNHIDTTIIYGPYWFNPLFLFIGSIIVTCSHWKNIVRLINKTENKLGMKTNQKMSENDSNNISNDQANKNKKHSNTSIINEATSTHNFNQQT